MVMVIFPWKKDVYVLEFRFPLDKMQNTSTLMFKS